MTAATKCLCPHAGEKWRGWSSRCPVHGCPIKEKPVRVELGEVDASKTWTVRDGALAGAEVEWDV